MTTRDYAHATPYTWRDGNKGARGYSEEPGAFVHDGKGRRLFIPGYDLLTVATDLANILDTYRKDPR